MTELTAEQAETLHRVLNRSSQAAPRAAARVLSRQEQSSPTTAATRTPLRVAASTQKPHTVGRNHTTTTSKEGSE